MSYERQEKVFNNIIQWLNEKNFKLENVRKFLDPNSEVKFYCEVQLVEHREEFVKIIIADQTRGSVLLQATVNFDKKMVNSLNLTPRKFRQQLFQKIWARLQQLGVNFEVKPEIGSVAMDKSIFFDSLTSKQIFFDNFKDIVRAMVLVNRAITEFGETIFRNRT